MKGCAALSRGATRVRQDALKWESAVLAKGDLLEVGQGDKVGTRELQRTVRVCSKTDRRSRQQEKHERSVSRTVWQRPVPGSHTQRRGQR